MAAELIGLALAMVAGEVPPAGTMRVIDEATTRREEPPPHGKIGTSTAYRISDGVPNRSMEFRKRILHPGSAIGAHLLAHDEVYYVLSGTGEAFSGERHVPVRAGHAVYFYSGETMGIRQTGREPLALIISYPLAERTR